MKKFGWVISFLEDLFQTSQSRKMKITGRHRVFMQAEAQVCAVLPAFAGGVAA